MSTLRLSIVSLFAFFCFIGCETTNHEKNTKKAKGEDQMFQDKNRYITEEEHNENLKSQLSMTPRTLSQLREYGVTEVTQLPLEYFFYTNTDVKASLLEKQLKSLYYDAEIRTTSNQNEFLVTGWTKKMTMTEDELIKWTRQMCDIGFDFDCEFDGWGTQPE